MIAFIQQFLWSIPHLCQKELFVQGGQSSKETTRRMALSLAGFLERPEEMSCMNSVKTNGFTTEGERDMGMPSLAVH